MAKNCFSWIHNGAKDKWKDEFTHYNEQKRQNCPKIIFEKKALEASWQKFSSLTSYLPFLPQNTWKTFQKIQNTIKGPNKCRFLFPCKVFLGRFFNLACSFINFYVLGIFFALRVDFSSLEASYVDWRLVLTISNISLEFSALGIFFVIQFL